MFQLWNLAFLCGLLTGTSALLGGLGNTLGALDPLKSVLGNGVNAVDPVKSVLGNGVNAVDPVKSVLGDGVNVDNTLQSSGVLQNLKVDLGTLQEAKDFQLAKSNILEALNLRLPDISDLPSVVNGLRLNINSLKILDIQAGLAKDGKGIELKVPVAADISLWLPLIGQTVDVSVNLNLITGLRIERDSQTNLPVVVVSKCSSNDDKISLSLLGRRSSLINLALDSVSKLLEKTVTFLLQKQVCPLIDFLTSNLRVDLVQNLSSVLQATPVQLPL